MTILLWQLLCIRQRSITERNAAGVREGKLGNARPSVPMKAAVLENKPGHHHRILFSLTDTLSEFELLGSSCCWARYPFLFSSRLQALHLSRMYQPTYDIFTYISIAAFRPYILTERLRLELL